MNKFDEQIGKQFVDRLVEFVRVTNGGERAFRLEGLDSKV